MAETAGNATTMEEIAPAVATETATLKVVPVWVTENQDLDSDASGNWVG